MADELVELRAVLPRADVPAVVRTLRRGSRGMGAEIRGVRHMLEALARTQPVSDVGHGIRSPEELEHTLEHMALRYPVTSRTLRRWCESGKLRARKSGSTWLARESDVAALVEQQRSS